MNTNRFTRYSVILAFVAASPLAMAQESTVEVKPGEEVKIAVPAEAAKKANPGVKVAVTQAYEKGSLSNVIQDSVTFSVLLKALKAADLDVTLGTKGSYTIFAPTDEAFAKLPAGALDKLLLPENKEKLRSLLLYHVIAGVVTSADLKDGDVKTMNGEKVEVDVEPKEIEINDSKVFSPDVMATNGVMHSLGKVLVPKSLDGFAKLDD